VTRSDGFGVMVVVALATLPLEDSLVDFFFLVVDFDPPL